MSRIGKEPVTIVDGVTCTVAGQKVTVKGKLGELSYEMHDGISAKVEDGKVVVTRKDDSFKALHGLSRALINNMVIGVSAGYTKKLVIEGTGFKAAPAVTGLKRISKPGLRRYVTCANIPVVLGGMGLAVVSTSKGVMSGKEAKAAKLGGEVICTVW